MSVLNLKFDYTVIYNKKRYNPNSNVDKVYGTKIKIVNAINIQLVR